MKVRLAFACCLFAISACRTVPDYSRPLPPGAPALLPLSPGEKHPDFSEQWNERDQILPALEQSIAWTKKDSSRQHFPIEGVDRERALASLNRFREILLQSQSGEEFERRIDEEFTVYKSAGWNGRGGGVLFTGYCTPILDGRLEADTTYRFPLYGLPPDLVKGPGGEILGQQTDDGLQPYPTRRIIEATSMLEGRHLELAWLKDPLDAFIAHVNGSAFIKLDDGSLYRLGYSGKNGRAYTSLGHELVKDKKIPKDAVSLASIRQWARSHPDELEDYLDRNDSYVFFTPIEGNPRGSLNVPVTAERTLATDKTLFPRGAIVFVDTNLHSSTNAGAQIHDFLLDQDTGGAIRTAGRADVYLGIGPQAETLAGTTRAEGQLYYLFLKQ